MNSNILLIIYLIIGILVACYDWKKYAEPQYRLAKQYGNLEDNMIPIYVTIIIFGWPIKVINYIFNK